MFRSEGSSSGSFREMSLVICFGNCCFDGQIIPHIDTQQDACNKDWLCNTCFYEHGNEPSGSVKAG
jgi:hypothetical protein